MSKEPVDAWRNLPPFDRYGDFVAARARPVLAPVPYSGPEPIFVNIEGSRVTVRLNPPRGESMELQFRWRKSYRAWQLYGREGARWVADGAPRASVGRLLDEIMRRALGPESVINAVLRSNNP